MKTVKTTKNIKKIVAIVLMVTMLALVFSGCKKEDDKPSVTTTTTGGATTTTGGETPTTTAPPEVPGPDDIDTDKYLYQNGYVNVLQDPYFDRGLLLGNVQDGIVPDPKDAINFKTPGATVLPIWTLAQWYSKYDIRDVTPVKEGDAYVFKNEGKTVTLGDDGAFTLEVLGDKEYIKEEHESGGGWAHLAMSQDVSDLPKLAEIDKAILKFDLKTNYLDNHMETEDPTKNTSLYTMAFVIQDRNEASPGFGDYFWLQLPLFDNRTNIFTGWSAADDGGKEIFTGKYMVSPASSEYYDGTFDVGKDISINADLYDLMKRSFDRASAAGYLTKSKFEDMTIASLSWGWEMMGAYNSSVTITKPSLTVRYTDGRSVAKNAAHTTSFDNAEDWSIKEKGSIIQDGTFEDLFGESWGSRAVVKNSVYSGEYTLETELRFSDGYTGDGWIGVSFQKPNAGASHDDGGYSLLLRPDGSLFFHAKNMSLGGTKLENFDPYTFTKIKIVAKDNTYTAYINDSTEPAASFTDDTYEGFGFVGVASGMAKSIFKNFTMTT